MQSVMAKTETEKHFFPSDLVPTAGHLHIAYIAAYDHNTVMVGKEKQAILAQACREKWIIYFCHDPYVEKGQVVLKNGKFALKVNENQGAEHAGS